MLLVKTMHELKHFLTFLLFIMRNFLPFLLKLCERWRER